MRSVSLSTAAFAFILLAGGLWIAFPATSFSVPSKEFGSISKALGRTQPGDTVWVDKGVYNENVFVPPGAALMARSFLSAVINAGGRGAAVTLSNSCTVSGFDIKNGTIGVLSTSSGNRIIGCRISGNTQSGLLCVGNLPRIEDNIIAYNKGSGVQGWDVRSTDAIISHNTIVYNSNHGLSIGGGSSIILENNIIAFNAQFAIKAEPQTARITLTKNDVFANNTPSGTLPSDNLADDPQFVAGANMDFTLSATSPCKGAAADQTDIGARTKAR
jgi:hypothetical protein